jgi:hypothetical protein
MLNCWLLIIKDWQEIPAFAGLTRYFDFWDSLFKTAERGRSAERIHLIFNRLQTAGNGNEWKKD